MEINGFSFFELASQPRSPVEGYAVDAARAERSLWFREGTAERRYAAAKALLGYNVLKLHTDGRYYIRRSLPHGYPFLNDGSITKQGDPEPNASGTPYLFATAIPRTEPAGKATGAPLGRSEYTDWRYDITYTTLPYRLKTDSEVLGESGTTLGGLPDEGDALRRGYSNTRFVSRWIELRNRVVELPQGRVQAYDPNSDVAASTPVPQGTPYPEFLGTVYYMWHFVPEEAVPFSAIHRCSQAVNLGFFDQFAEGTLLLTTTSITKPYQGPLGGRFVDITYAFGWKPAASYYKLAFRGWNSALTVVRGTYNGVVEDRWDYHPVSFDGTAAGRVPFAYRKMARLFAPDQTIVFDALVDGQGNPLP